MSEHLTNLLAVGCIARDGKILVAKRSNTKKMFPDRYELLGGHLEPGEQPWEALSREVLEEVGLEIIVGQPVYVFTEQIGDVFYMEVVYLCSLKDPTAEPTLDPAEHSESRWIEEGDIDSLGKDDKEIIALRNAFEQLEGESK